MQYATTLSVTRSIELAKVPIDGKTDRVLDVYIIRAERDAVFGQEALGFASIWTGPVANVSFDVYVHPFERHHAAEEHRPELDDVLHDMDQQMHHNVEECRWEVDLKLA